MPECQEPTLGGSFTPACPGGLHLVPTSHACRPDACSAKIQLAATPGHVHLAITTITAPPCEGHVPRHHDGAIAFPRIAPPLRGTTSVHGPAFKCLLRYR